jgi:hypothetical protein
MLDCADVTEILNWHMSQGLIKPSRVWKRTIFMPRMLLLVQRHWQSLLRRHPSQWLRKRSMVAANRGLLTKRIITHVSVVNMT